MKDLSRAKHCLGLRIHQLEGKITLDQENYLNDVLTKFNMSECKTVKTPMQPSFNFSSNEDDTQDMKNIPYREAIGSLQFLASITRPDIAYAVNKLSQFCSSPNKSHWTAVKHLMRYLKGTKQYKLEYVKGQPSEIVAYCDADWAGD